MIISRHLFILSASIFFAISDSDRNENLNIDVREKENSSRKMNINLLRIYFENQRARIPYHHVILAHCCSPLDTACFYGELNDLRYACARTRCVYRLIFDMFTFLVGKAFGDSVCLFSVKKEPQSGFFVSAVSVC